ncbi:MAG: HDIG domain-containing metalloprotein [Clostridiaceae bacterium]|nr:HDIG domain-containing protein [Eubacteriales bacterium]
MAKSDRKLRIPLSYARYFSAALLAVAFLAMYVIAALQLTPKRYELSVGSTAPETIYAARDVVDDAASEALRALARRNAPKVYRIDTDKVASLRAEAQGFFDALGAMRSDAKNIVLNAGGNLADFMDAGAWSELLSAEQAASLAARSKPALGEAMLFEVLAASETELSFLEDLVLPKLNIALSAGLSEGSLESILRESKLELAAASRISDTLKAVGDGVLDAYMQPTYLLDETATYAAQEEAASKIADITVKKGEVLASEGEILTETQVELLEKLGLVRPAENDVSLKIGVAVYLLVVYAVVLAYFFVLHDEILVNLKSVTILSAFLTLTALVTWAVAGINAHMTLVLLAVMLAALLVSESAGFAVAVVTALFSGLMACGGGVQLFGLEYATMLLSTLASGVVTVLSLRKTHNRGAIIAAGAMGGVAAAVATAGVYVAAGGTAAALLTDMGWAFGSSLLSAMLVVGSLSIWENLFDVATAARLNELLNTTQPLLKQLMQEAPGTYQHSMLVAALAEAAAERIGANSLLARVGAVYHDVGKLKRPLYFKENQKPNDNIHDTLPPAESASVIIAHQKDGVALLVRHKLPSSVVRIAAEHHGNALMAYFYGKAAEEGGVKPNPKAFRYAGNKPSSKESAIVMLADSCEAAVRSLGNDCTREQREEMVHRLLWSKLGDPDNLLTNAPVTLSDLSAIEASFLKTFNGILHDRVEYPGQKGKEP